MGLNHWGLVIAVAIPLAGCRSPTMETPVNALSPFISAADWGITPRDVEAVRAVLPQATGWRATVFDALDFDPPVITVDGPGGFQALIGKEVGQFHVTIWDDGSKLGAPRTIRGLSTAGEAAFALLPVTGHA